MNTEKVTIPYTTMFGKPRDFEKILKLPVDIKESKRKTRSESQNIITSTACHIK
jgi:hypothetical protein